MSDLRVSPPTVDPRVWVAVAVIVLATLYVLVQHTSIAPFPHSADDFVGGLAIGVAIATVPIWWSGRKGR